jgi:hypothetical protein
MSRKVRSVRVPPELGSLDLSGIVRDCEGYLRDVESATLLKTQGNKEAAEALLKTRQSDLGRRIAHRIHEARLAYSESRKNHKD